MYKYTILNIKLKTGSETISVYSKNKYSTNEWNLAIKNVIDSFTDEEWDNATFELIQNRIKEMYNDFIIPKTGAIIDCLVTRKDMKISDIEFMNQIETNKLKGFNIVVK